MLRLICSVLLALLVAPWAHAQTIGYAVGIEFTEPHLNTDGSQLIDLKYYQGQIRDNGDLIHSQKFDAISAAPVEGTEEQRDFDVLQLTQGKNYEVRLRACDDAVDPFGDPAPNCSDWAVAPAGVDIPVLDTSVPEAPTIISVTITPMLIP